MDNGRCPLSILHHTAFDPRLLDNVLRGGGDFLGLLGEDHHDARTSFGVVLAEVAEFIALPLASDGLDVESSAGPRLRTGLDVLRLDGEDQGGDQNESQLTVAHVVYLDRFSETRPG